MKIFYPIMPFSRYLEFLLLAFLLTGVSSLEIAIGQSGGFQGPNGQDTEQLKIEARERAEAIAREILRSETLPSAKKPKRSNLLDSYTQPVRSTSTEHRTINVDVTGMPVGWNKTHWQQIQESDRSLVLQLAKLGLVSAAPEKPEWVVSDFVVNKLSGYIEEGKKAEPVFGLSVLYQVMQAGGGEAFLKVANGSKRNDAESQALTDYWMSGFTNTFRDYNDACRLRIAKQFMAIRTDVKLEGVLSSLQEMERKFLNGGKGALSGWKILLEFKEKYPFLFR